MHSADYAVARCLSVCPSVCPSVRQSHAGFLSKRLNISSKFFSLSGSQAILVFPYQTVLQYSDGNPRPQWGIKIIQRGVWKKSRFLPISRFISKTIQDRELSNGAIFNYLEWPLTQISRSRYYLTLISRKWYMTELYLQRRTISRIWVIERRHIQRLWTALTHDFKITPLLDGEYLRNGTR